MLNLLWAGMIIAGVFFAAFTGQIPEITKAALDSSKEAVTLCITISGVMAFSDRNDGNRPGSRHDSETFCETFALPTFFISRTTLFP